MTPEVSQSRETIHELCDALLLNGNTVKADIFRKHDAAQRAEIERLKAELEQHAWKISPAMAQAKIEDRKSTV